MTTNRHPHEQRRVITKRLQEFMELRPHGSVLKLYRVSLVLPGREVVEYLHTLFMENPNKLVRDLEQVENDIEAKISSGGEVSPEEIEQGKEVFLVLHKGELVAVGNVVAKWPA